MLVSLESGTIFAFSRDFPIQRSIHGVALSIDFFTAKMSTSVLGEAFPSSLQDDIQVVPLQECIKDCKSYFPVFKINVCKEVIQKEFW